LFKHLLQAFRILYEAFSLSMTFMDRKIDLFQGEFVPASVPARRPAAMPAQPIVPWTLARVTAASLDWLMAETVPTLPAPISTTTKRRV
jgi:hypothetical protein